MNLDRMSCAICNQVVEVAVVEGAKAAITPLLGTAGGAIGAKKAGTSGAIVGALAGILVSALVHAWLVPKVQRIVCTKCGTHLA